VGVVVARSIKETCCRQYTWACFVSLSLLTFFHDCGKESVLSGFVEADEVHAAVATKVPSVEPVPVLELVPRFPPGEEVVVIAPLHVRNT
jgi:hypothetical protein